MIISQLERTLPRQAQAVRERFSQLCDQLGQLLDLIYSLYIFQIPQIFLCKIDQCGLYADGIY